MRRFGGQQSHRWQFAQRLLVGFIVALCIVSGATEVLRITQAASAPNIMSYQGRVLNANGVPISDATASLKFELYTASSGGTCLWSNSSSSCDTNNPSLTTARTVTLTDGLFSENLGDTSLGVPYAAIPDSVFANNAAVYLQVYIGAETLSPRKQIAAAPYAINSDTLDGFDATQTGGTSAAVLVLDSSGNLQITGNPTSGVGGGSLYINPAGADIANEDTLFGLAVGGSSRMTIDEDGDATLAGDLAVNGGDINSTAAISLVSTGGNISLNPNGSGLAYVVSGDDFAVGASSLTAPFSVDEDTNTVRIGDGVSDANDPKFVMYASDGVDSGTLGFADDDRFSFSGADVTHDGLGTLPTTAGTTTKSFDTKSTFTGTSLANLNTIELYSLGAANTYSAIENAVSTDHIAGGAQATLSISGATTTLSQGYGLIGYVSNTSTNASLLQSGGYLAGVEASAVHNAAATTIPLVYGAHGSVGSNQGTITDAMGMYGEIKTSAGGIANGYGGYFTNKSAGSSRYGLWAEASGGVTNISGYFTGARLQVDDDNTPNSPGLAANAGDLFIVGALESDGSVSLGDTTGTDSLTFTSAATTGTVAQFVEDSLESGTGFMVRRGNTGNDFTGTLAHIQNSKNSAGSTGDVLVVENQAAGSSTLGVYVIQGTVTNATNGAGGTTLGSHALVVETTEAGSDDDLAVFRANGQIVLAIESDGSVLSDNAYSSGGADYAEYFVTNDATLSGMEIVCHDRLMANAVKRCESGNAEVMGVVSTTPGFIGGLPENESGADTVIVGLTGQIDTLVTADEGPIAVGDPITQSSTSAGVGAKAHGPVRIIGFALEAHSNGQGVIKVFVNPQWYGGDMLTNSGTAIEVAANLGIASLGQATVTAPTFNSAELALRGSAWMAGSATERSMSLMTTVSTADDYRLSVKNVDGIEVAYVNNQGDFGVSGKLYPSDRGVAQTDKYIYYDGSSGGGGDFMRTNAAGWGTGSYDFAEMFASPDVLLPGEVVVFGDANEQVKRSLGETYDQKIAGVVSTRPGFLAGDNLPGQYPIALAGRVPTAVTGENGSIAIGDPLTSSSRPGFAMKATEAGPILGYATEAFMGAEGRVVAFINPSYYDGGPVEEGPSTDNVVSGFAAQISLFDVSGSLNLNGGSILSIASLQGIGNTWNLQEDGDFVTRGRLVQLIRSYQNEEVETYAAASREMTVQISGTATLAGGRAIISFEDIDQQFNDIIATDVPYRVLVTPYGATGQLFVADRTLGGFSIIESGAVSEGVAVDWLVIAYHKDYAPVLTTNVVPEVTSEAAVETVEVILPAVAPVAEPEEVITEPIIEAPSTDILSTDEESTVTIEPEMIVE